MCSPYSIACKIDFSQNLKPAEEELAWVNENDQENDEEQGQNQDQDGLMNKYMDIMTVVLVTTELVLVLFLSFFNFSRNQELQGLAMLCPLLMNSVGVMYFLSESSERSLMYNISNRKCFTDFYQLPVIGPVLMSFKVLGYGQNHKSSRSNSVSYHRMEALATKMKQAVTYFSGAPEALVQLSVLLCSEKKEYFIIVFLEIVTVSIICIGLAEANLYGLRSPYYRMFKEYEPNDWKLSEIGYLKKSILFLNALTSITISLISNVFVIYSAKYYFGFKERSFKDFYVIVLAILFQVNFRMCFHYIHHLAEDFLKGEYTPGCYQAIMYGWRTTILDFGFQSKNIFNQIWFYVEKILSFVLWVSIVINYGGGYFGQYQSIIPTVFIFLLSLFMSLFTMLVCHKFKLMVP